MPESRRSWHSLGAVQGGDHGGPRVPGHLHLGGYRRGKQANRGGDGHDQHPHAHQSSHQMAELPGEHRWRESGEWIVLAPLTAPQ